MHWKLNLLAGLCGVALIGVMFFFIPEPAATSSLQFSSLPHKIPAATKRLRPKAHPQVAPAVYNIKEGVLSHRTLYEALTSCEIPPSEVLSLSRSFRPVFDFRCAKPKDIYRVSLNDQNEIQKFVYKTSLMDEYEAIKKKDGSYTVQKREIALDKTVISKVFTINSSLYQAVADFGESQRVAGMIAEIFAWDIDFYTAPRKGDRIAVVYEQFSRNGRFVRYGKILAARYETDQRDYSAFLFNDGHFDNYFDENGQPLKNMFLRSPLKFGKMTSGYSIRRFHPICKRYKAHTGIDYGSPTGTPILATANGKVTFAGWKNGYGKLLIVRHPNGYETYYGHCSRLLKKSGQLVEQGQVIARVGQTGLATGPHVHYEVRIKGTPVNPNNLKKTRVTPLRPSLMAKFKKVVNERTLLVMNALREKGKLVNRPTEAESLDSVRKKA